VKWSGKNRQCAKMHPALRKGSSNDKETQILDKFKATVVLEALRSGKTAQEIAVKGEPCVCFEAIGGFATGRQELEGVYSSNMSRTNSIATEWGVYFALVGG